MQVLTSRRNMVYAWSLKDDTIMQVRLPVRANSYTVYENRVGIVLGNQEVLIWTIGGHLRLLSYSWPRVEQGFHSFQHQAVIFHPFCPRSISLISTFQELVSEDHYCPVILARSYSSTANPKNDGGIDWSDSSTLVWTEVLHKDCPHPHNGVFRYPDIPPRFSILVTAISDTGDFSLYPTLPITFFHPELKIDKKDRYKVEQIRFNVCEKRFSHAVYLCPPWESMVEPCVWNGMMHVHQLQEDDSIAGCGIEKIMGIKPLNEKFPDSSLPRPYTSTDLLWIGEIDQSNEEQDHIQFTWTRRYQKGSYEWEEDDDLRPILFADDDFVVSFRLEEATIACYNKKDDLTSLGGVRVNHGTAT